jgi:hypothetical protein
MLRISGLLRRPANRPVICVSRKTIVAFASFVAIVVEHEHSLGARSL